MGRIFYRVKSLATSPRPTCEPCNRAAFLDRDGVINVDHGYVSRLEDFEFLPGAIEGLRLLHDAGYKLIVVTNQSGIARGYFTEADYQSLTIGYTKLLAQQGIVLSGVYHCPHHQDYPTGGQPTYCTCRKPAPGLILKAAFEHSILLNESILIGDNLSDILAGQKAGVATCYLIKNAKKVLPSLSRESHQDCEMAENLLVVARAEIARSHLCDNQSSLT